MKTQRTPVALAIAGSEASGGAGAQTDLRTFTQLDVFGCVALTCIVSFDPKQGFDHRFVPVEPQVLADQVEAAVGVHGQVDAVKIGMLGTVPTIETVAQALKQYHFPQVVVDPVLICKGQEPGAALDIDNALREQVLPLATITTPNRPGRLLRRQQPGGAGGPGHWPRARLRGRLHPGRRHHRRAGQGGHTPGGRTHRQGGGRLGDHAPYARPGPLRLRLPGLLPPLLSPKPSRFPPARQTVLI